MTGLPAIPDASVLTVMDAHGFATAGEAIEWIGKQQP